MPDIGNETSIDEHGVIVFNETAVPDAEIWENLSKAADPAARAIASWIQGTQRRRPKGGILERDRFVTPERIYEQMEVAQRAAQEDDVVAGVLESTEALALSSVSIECEDEDEEDIWNQIAGDLDLDSRLREMWRELFVVSQFYGAIYWTSKDYKVRGRSPKTGVKRKAGFKGIQVPESITLLDPMKVCPVGNLMFNMEELVYSANRDEGLKIGKELENRSDDIIVASLITERYEATRHEKKLLSDMGIPTGSLWKLNPENVFRHTATRPQYNRFADVRLRSVFEILDLKHQLREMDRAHLLGSTNFIVLIKIGDKDKEGKQAEIDAMNAQVRTLARVPVIVGDHRLNIEIVTPSTDHTLDPDRYNLLNNQISSRLYQTFLSAGSVRGDDSLKLARVVGRGMESRRHMLRRCIERYILKPIFDKNDQFTSPPKLQFHPKQIALDFDAALASFMFDLRDRGDISRETILNQIDLDQDDEFRNRKREKDSGMDDTFQTTVPFSGAGPQNGQPGADKKAGGGGDPKAAGRTQGGNRSGGGAAPGSGQGQPARNPRRKSG